MRDRLAGSATGLCADCRFGHRKIFRSQRMSAMWAAIAAKMLVGECLFWAKMRLRFLVSVSFGVGQVDHNLLMKYHPNP